MTTSDPRKMMKQLRTKPVKLKKYLKHNMPKERTTGRARWKCARCGRIGGHVRRYGLNLCRHCFREIAVKIGFKKFGGGGK